jgi:hypothetical protein
MQRHLFTAALIALLASPASATPPQVVSVTDVLLGANETHLFLLRQTDDNMGRYQPLQSDVLLVARNRSTNLDEEIWPVSRSIDSGPEFADEGNKERLEVLALEGAVNPFDILAAKKAAPMLGRIPRAADELGASTAIKDDALVIDDSNSGTYRIGFAEITEKLKGNLNHSRDVLPAYFVEGGDVLRDVELYPATECNFDAFIPLWDMKDGEAVYTWLTQMTCLNEEMLVPITTYLVVPASL